MSEQREKQLNDKLDYLGNTKALIAEALTQVGAEVTPDMTFRQYANLISTLGSGKVLLFETVAEMNAYENPKEGTLAVVYKSMTSSLLGVPTRYVVFPDEAVVDTEMTVTRNVNIWDASGLNVIGVIRLAPTSVTITMYDSDINILYTSEDGINYVRETAVQNPVDMGTIIFIPAFYSYNHYIDAFMEIESGIFNGLYCCKNGTFISVNNQFTVNATNQILTGYTAYGSNGTITGDGTYISNIKTSEYINKYLPNIADIGTQSIIQNGSPVKAMTFVQREKLPIDDAFEATFDEDDCIVQIADIVDVNSDTSSYSTLIQNYLNTTRKFNYAFFIGETAYRLYIGFNYNTTQVHNAFSDQYQTVPYQMTALYGFIVNLADLSIYKTFQNNDSWVFTNNGFGNLLTYAYSVKSDCLVLLTDMDGWLSTGGAYIGLTTIKAGTGVRSTQYYNITYDADYEYKSVAYTSYDNAQDCYYLAYKSANRGITASSIKRICKLTPSGTLTSLYTSSEDMKNINCLWSSTFKNLDSILCYTTDNKGSVLRNLATGNEFSLYGSNISNYSYFGLDDTNIYLSHKINSSDTKYNVCRINKDTLVATVIPDTESDDRLTNCFYSYNRDLAIFYDNKVISLQGEFLAWFMKALLTNPSISGIDRLDEFGYKASFMDYQLNITANQITAKVPKYSYYRYFDIDSFPAPYDICMVMGGNTKTATGTNDSTSVLKCKSVILTENKADPEEIRKAIASTERILGNSDPSETARYIKELQDTIEEAVELTNEIKGMIDNE